ncbi:MAG: Ribosomal protein L1 [Candidatus Alkanophagales archaeon MCA70_species_2]|nr:Ribosomal protein L1 [Candidatus Alkanophaga liquidiphilum]
MIDEGGLEEAVKEALRSKQRNFLESVDLTIALRDVDMNQPKNRINLDVVVPHKFREPKILVFASGELAFRAKQAGLEVITPEELKDIDKKKARELAKNFDFFIAEPTLMPQIGRTLGTILGPRGKMPTPVPPNADISQIISRLEKTVRVRTRALTLHVKIGNKNMPPSQIAENAAVIVKRVASALEGGWNNIAAVYVKTTMGHAVRVE